MKRNDMSARLAVLESDASKNPAKLAEDDPRVVAYRQKAMQRLADKVREAATGIKEWEHLDPPGRIEYWREKVAEAESLSASNGVAEDDDIDQHLHTPFILRTHRELRLKLACENIDEYRQMLAAAEQAIGVAA